LAAEYAKCKNRHYDFTVRVLAVRVKPRIAQGAILQEGNPAMTDASLRAATAPQPEQKTLSEAAKRALAEAETRRLAAEANTRPRPREFQGPKGPEPTRYGDWENKGIASDF
jgi:hypothetical protein